MSDWKQQLELEARNKARAEFEGWVGRRHWFWLLLILVLSGGYVELPINLPIVFDDWIAGSIAAATTFELWRRIRANWDAAVSWTLSLPGRAWRRVFGTRQANTGRG